MGKKRVPKTLCGVCGVSATRAIDTMPCCDNEVCALLNAQEVREAIANHQEQERKASRLEGFAKGREV